MMNPVFESSARRRMRSWKTPLVITAYLCALLALSASQLTAFMGQGVSVGRMRLGIECYIWLTAIQLLLIVLVAPALSAVSIAGERERQTFDLLLVTGIGTRRIVMGKMMESFSFLALLILSGAPVQALVLLTGGVTLGDVVMTLLYLAAIAFAALSVGMVASVLMRRSLTAIIVSYLSIFAIGALAWALAKHGPLAAKYTYKSLQALADMPVWQILAGMPVTIFFCPPVGLVMLLASQTGILHMTMEHTMRLNDIYSAARYAGFGSVSMASLGAVMLAAAGMTALAILLLTLQTQVRRRKG